MVTEKTTFFVVRFVTASVLPFVNKLLDVDLMLSIFKYLVNFEHYPSELYAMTLK